MKDIRECFDRKTVTYWYHKGVEDKALALSMFFLELRRLSSLARNHTFLFSNSINERDGYAAFNNFECSMHYLNSSFSMVFPNARNLQLGGDDSEETEDEKRRRILNIHKVKRREWMSLVVSHVLPENNIVRDFFDQEFNKSWISNDMRKLVKDVRNSVAHHDERIDEILFEGMPPQPIKNPDRVVNMAVEGYDLDHGSFLGNYYFFDNDCVYYFHNPIRLGLIRHVANEIYGACDEIVNENMSLIVSSIVEKENF